MKHGFRRICLAAVVAIAAMWTGSAAAQGHAGGKLGLGLMAGSPTALSMEYGLSASNSIHFALGIEGVNNKGRDGDIYIHAVWRFYLAELASTGDFSLPIYLGIGGFVADIGNNKDNDSIDLGARVPFGIAFSFNRVPIDIFLELPLYLQLVDDFRIGVGGALGFHYFF